MGNIYSSLDSLRSLSRPTAKSQYAIAGVRELSENYQNRNATLEECVEMAVEDLALSNQVGILVGSNLSRVEKIVSVVEHRNNYVRKQKAMGVESFQGAKMIDGFALSTEGKVKDFFSRILNGIKEAFRKLIVVVGNIIRTVISWVRSGTVKKQAKFYEIYKNAPLKEGWKTEKMKSYPYVNGLIKSLEIMKVVSAQEGGAQSVGEKIHKYVEDYTGGNAWKAKKDTHGVGERKTLYKEVGEELEKLISRFKVSVTSKKNGTSEKAAMWSGNAVYNQYVFGTTKPEKKEMTWGEVVKGISGSETGFGEVLGMTATAGALKIVAIGRKMIKGLSTDVKLVEKIAKSALKTEEWKNSADKDKKVAKGNVSAYKLDVAKALNAMRSYKGIVVNNLMSSFMNYVRMRTVVFSIFVKSIKKNDGFKEYKKGIKKDKDGLKTINKGLKDKWKGVSDAAKNFRKKSK